MAKKQKTIVTHVSPDLDGIPAAWLLKKYHPDFADARLVFVPAGQSLDGKPAGSDPDVVHVDTGGGPFDHHQSDDFTCAAKLVYEYLLKEGYIKSKNMVLERMVHVLTELDHGWDNWKWPDAANDRYEFMLHNILFGWKMIYSNDTGKYVDLTMQSLEAVYALVSSKVKADELLDSAIKFSCRWGNAIALESGNGMVLDLAVKKGFALALTKDPKRGNVRVTGSNAKDVDLSKAYELCQKADSEASWFLHASNVLLRNGSTRNPTMKATKLTLDEMIEILKKA